MLPPDKKFLLLLGQKRFFLSGGRERREVGLGRRNFFFKNKLLGEDGKVFFYLAASSSLWAKRERGS